MKTKTLCVTVENYVKVMQIFLKKYKETLITNDRKLKLANKKARNKKLLIRYLI